MARLGSRDLIWANQSLSWDFCLDTGVSELFKRVVHSHLPDERRNKVCRQEAQVTERGGQPHEGPSTRGSNTLPFSQVRLPQNKRSSGSHLSTFGFSLQVEEPSAPTWGMELAIAMDRTVDGADHSHGAFSPWHHPLCCQEGTTD